MEFRFRSAVLLSFFAIWALAAAITLYYRTVVNGGALTENSEAIARREGIQPPVRGRILDADGVPLAWTEMRFSLYLHPSPRKVSADLKKILLDRFQIDPVPASDVEPVLLREDVSVRSEEEQTFLLSLSQKYPRLSVRTELCRCYIEPAPEELGSCEKNELGILRGIDGAEKEYDSRLRGSEGIFTIMLDRRGAWMPGTMKMVKMPVPGEDVKLSFTLEELRKRATLKAEAEAEE